MLQGHVKVAVPFNKSNMRFFHEPVLRTFDPNSNTWTSIDSFENIYFDENDSVSVERWSEDPKIRNEKIENINIEKKDT